DDRTNAGAADRSISASMANGVTIASVADRATDSLGTVARLRIALCQLDVTVGDLEGNVQRIVDAYEQAEAAGCDIAAFTELTIPGYPPEDLVLKPGF